jgi:hypothetical protein
MAKASEIKCCHAGRGASGLKNKLPTIDAATTAQNERNIFQKRVRMAD